MESITELPTSLTEFWQQVLYYKELSINDLKNYIQHLADHRMIIIETFAKITQNMADIYLVIDNKYHIIQTISDKSSKFNLFPERMIKSIDSDKKIMFPFTLFVYSELIQFPIIFNDEDIQ